VRSAKEWLAGPFIVALSLALSVEIGACSEPVVEALPAYATCTPDPRAFVGSASNASLEIGRVGAGGFVAAQAGDPIEIAPWPETHEGSWCALAALRLTAPSATEATLCVRVLGSAIERRTDGDRGVLMTRGSDGAYVAPVVPLSVPLRNTDFATFFEKLGKPVRFDVAADTISAGALVSGQAAPIDLTIVNRVGFLATAPPGSGSVTPGDAGVTPAIDLYVGQPGVTVMSVPRGGSAAITVNVSGRRAGLAVHLALGSPLPSGVQLTLSRYDIPATATDAEAYETAGTLTADATVAVGARFDVVVEASAGGEVFRFVGVGQVTP
jgi:hypothetical protein